jgi:hypothetical protein
MKHFLFILVLFFCCSCFAQENPTVEQQIENITEVEESETEDDSYLQSLQHYLKNKLNLNTATETDLKEFPFLSPLQLTNFFTYRKLFGKLISIYELQAVPSWNLETIQKIIPFVTAGPALSVKEDFYNRFSSGEHSLLSRFTYVPEKAQGFRRKNDSNATSFYPGGRERLLLRYKYQYKNLFQYGITAEKDPGEQWFKGAQKNGFDFYSAHLFARNIGIIKHLALGDFTVNMGQGLMQWQAIAFKKSVDVMNIKRQAAVLRPFNSTSEFFYNRGAGITLEKGNIQVTGFASFRKVSANIITDTSRAEDFFSSLLSSGLHRTKNEQADKNALQMNVFGGNIGYTKNNFHFGFNGIHYQFNRPFNREDVPHNNFTFRGTKLTNFSANWATTWRNIHWFGELANHNANNYAFISGVQVSVDPKIDLSLLYRNIQKGYQSIFGNAFTEGTFPTNEKGFFAGVSIRPYTAWKLDAYMDLYRFPYLRFRVDAPSNGYDYMAQLTYKPDKQVEIYTRYRQESRPLNFNNNGELNTSIIEAVPRKNWRTQIQYKLNAVITLRQRIDLMWYDLKGPRESRGYLTYADIFYKPLSSPLSANIRLQYLDTQGFDSRIYTYENDVLYSFSIPAFFNKGYRYYINFNYDINKKLSFWLRWAQLIRADDSVIGSGLDEIPGNQRSELKVQMLWKIN